MIVMACDGEGETTTTPYNNEGNPRRSTEMAQTQEVLGFKVRMSE